MKFIELLCRQDADVIEISTPAGTNFTLREDDASMLLIVE